MVGKQFGVVVFAILALSVQSLLAQKSDSPSPAPAQKPAPSASPQKLSEDDKKRQAEFQQVQRFFDQMSPDERQRFAENLKRWQGLPPSEKQYLKQQEDFRQGKIAQEIACAIQQSGLQLDQDRQEVYALRYTQERRKVEQRLRKEMEERRKPLLADMMRRLKIEFSESSSGSTPALAPLPVKPHPAITVVPANTPKPSASPTVSPAAKPSPSASVSPKP
jgi:hypothetical protein